MRDRNFIYVNMNSSFCKKILNCSDFKVLISLFKESLSYSPDFVYGNKFYVNPASIERIIKYTGKCSGTVRNSICSLSKLGLVLKHPEYRGLYYLNPVYFFKGNLDYRKKCIDACINDKFIV